MISNLFFVLILIYAAIWDFKTRTVQDVVWITVAVLGVVNFKPSAITGALAIFIPMLVLALYTNLGGGDVKLAGACGFYMGIYAAVPGLLIACISACVLVPIYCVIKKRQVRQTVFPFVPFLSFGFILMTILSLRSIS